MMENRINKILTLKDDRKYVVLNQAIYKDKNYFLAGLVNDDITDFTGEYKILEEFDEDNVKYVRTVKDPALLEMLAKYLQPKL